jgi:hypothetical protein
MKYYIPRPNLNQPKNKAQEHIRKFIEMFFNMLVNSDEDLTQLIEKIEKEVEETNSNYRQCRKIEMRVDNYESSDSIDIWIRTGIDSPFAHLHAKKVYAEYHRGFIENHLL